MKKGVVHEGISKIFSRIKTRSSKKLMGKEEVGVNAMKNVVKAPRELRD